MDLDLIFFLYLFDKGFGLIFNDKLLGPRLRYDVVFG